MNLDAYADTNQKLKSMDKIGKGTFATVYSNDQLDVAFKKVGHNGPLWDEQIREATISALIREHQLNGVPGSKACVKILSVMIGATGFIIAMEKAPRSLFKMIISDDWNGNVGPVFDLSRGVNYLHKMSIWHRDIKPSNVLVYPTSNGNFIAKLCDFGQSRPHGSKFGIEDSTKDCQTTYLYALPALLKRDTRPEVGCKADWYALAATILHALFPTHFYLKEETEERGLEFALNTIPKLVERAATKVEAHHMDLLWEWVSTVE